MTDRLDTLLSGLEAGAAAKYREDLAARVTYRQGIYSGIRDILNGIMKVIEYVLSRQTREALADEVEAAVSSLTQPPSD